MTAYVEARTPLVNATRFRAAHEADWDLLDKILTLIEKRGQLGDQDIQRFLSAGHGEDLLLETITIVAASTITNYTSSVTRPPLEAPFEEFAWHAPAC